MNRKNIQLWAVRLVLIALIVLWMSTIFGFSAETGVESQSLSDKITIRVVNIIKPDYKNLSVAEQNEFFSSVSFVVRKTGHFGEYAILDILIMTLLVTFNKVIRVRKGALATVITTLVGMLYAAGDEFHQGFVDGRSPKFFDVGIDTAGVFTGTIFILIIYLLVRRRHERLER